MSFESTLQCYTKNTAVGIRKESIINGITLVYGYIQPRSHSQQVNQENIFNIVPDSIINIILAFYLILSDSWDILTKHPEVLLLDEENRSRSRSTITRKKSYSGGIFSILGEQIISKNEQQIWRVKYVSGGDNHQCPWFFVGILDCTCKKNEVVDHCHYINIKDFTKEEKNIGYYHNGYSYNSHSGEVFTSCSDHTHYDDEQYKKLNYGRKLKVGDILTLSLDMRSGALSFLVNETHYGIAFQVDTSKQYRFGVSLTFPGTHVRLLE